MQLLGSTRSPYACKARVVAIEKGVDCELVDTSPRDETVAKANPLAKVPTLIRDDGRALYDSVVIVEYLDGLAEHPRLIPQDFEGRIEVKRWEALADGVIDALIDISHERREPEDRRKGPDFFARQQKKVEAGLARMEADIGDREFCHGESLTLADLACGCALLYVDRTQPDSAWRGLYPSLARVFGRLSKRKSFLLLLKPVSR
jgi:glutathione S-transferase